jgi:glycosylphosphatidylinositol transamidase (GPIT) subunit GPI8
MIDTCQANTMYSQIYSPNILATGSSELGENSYSVCYLSAQKIISFFKKNINIQFFILFYL